MAEGSITDLRISALGSRELELFRARGQASEALAGRAASSLAGGVGSSFQQAEPWPIHFARGAGARVWDVDGIERIDLHLGFGSAVHGHGNEAIAAAVRERYAVGSQFGAPTDDAVAVAEELARRFGLPLWRFSNSGTEAAADALRIARGATGRTTVIIGRGAYHGVGVAEGPETRTVPFNNPGALEQALAAAAREGSPAACVMLEPALMLGVVEPVEGYLATARELAHAAGALLILDEAKTGLSIAAGGATERFCVIPDLVVLAKALGGGIPAAAVGGTEAAMAKVTSGEILQAGTFNANPLAMASARACLEQVLTAVAYERIDRVSGHLVEGLARICAGVGVAAQPFGLGARGSLVFGATPVRDDLDFAAARRPGLERALWLYAANRGVYLTPARPLNWSLSVAHTQADADAYLTILGEFLAEVG